MLANLVGAQVVDIGLAILDKFDRPFIELVEIIGGVEKSVPLVAEPADVGLDRLHVFGFFLLGIGVVEAEIRMSAEFVGQAEVDADCLGMADVEIAVGLGREAGLHTAIVLVGLKVFENDVADEVRRSRRRRGGCSFFSGFAWGK